MSEEKTVDIDIRKRIDDLNIKMLDIIIKLFGVMDEAKNLAYDLIEFLHQDTHGLIPGDLFPFGIDPDALFRIRPF